MRPGVTRSSAPWQRFERASNTFTSLLHDLRSLAPEAAPGLIAATVLGIIRLDLPPQVAVDRAAALLAITINAVGPFGDVPVPVVIEASRAALRQAPMPLPDLLPNATARILRADTADGGFGAKHGMPHLRADNGW